MLEKDRIELENLSLGFSCTFHFRIFQSFKFFNDFQILQFHHRFPTKFVFKASRVY